LLSPSDTEIVNVSSAASRSCFVERARPDVIVVGARQHRHVARILGSVSTKVANESPCRVEVVPAG
jgi:nucleotide-binding universal stress UspA family protein